MNVDERTVRELEIKAVKVKKNLCTLIHDLHKAGHIGGALSAADVITALHYHFMKFDPQNPKWEGRDRLIVSKGHISLLMYVVLAGHGMFALEDVCREYNKIDGRFAQHANRLHVPGIEASTGSLGHGLSISLGMALCARSRNETWRTYCVVGDGEIQEGSNWEAIMAAGKYGMKNLCLIVDCNGMQGSQFVSDTVGPDNLPAAIGAFGWNVVEINGRDMREICDALSTLPEIVNPAEKGKPTCIISRTIKGAGVSFMENNPKWHANKVTDEQLQQALAELDAAICK